MYCACLEGASCTAPHATLPAAVPGGAVDAGGAGGAWAGAVLAMLSLLAAVLAALYLLHRRRQSVPRYAACVAGCDSRPCTNSVCLYSGAFVHARLSDNVEINNPMYLAGEDELEPPHNNHTHNVSTAHAPATC